MSTSAPVTGLTITDSALGKIREVMGQQQLADDERNLRVFVEGGGCCGGGPSFGLAFDRAQDDDVRMEQSGLKIIVDPMSAPFVAGATIDWLDNGEIQGFKVNAPALQQQSSGGCGGGSCGSGEGGGGGGGGCGSGGGGGCGSGGGHSHGHEHGAEKAHSHGGGGGCGCG